MIELFRGICGYFPEVELKSRMLRGLGPLGMEPARYAGMAIVLSGLMLILAAMAAALFNPLFALPAGLLAFAAVLGFFLMLPGIELKKRNAEIETELPLFLRTVGTLLELRLPFQKAMEIASEDEGALQNEMRAALAQMQSGMSPAKALSFLASSDSLAVKRALSQLLSVYETGGTGRELKRIGDELLAIERHRMREYSARSAMFGLMFMISSAVLPTFFLVYAVIGRFAMGGTLSEMQMAIGLLVVFPLISILILAISKATMPRSALAGNGGLDLSLAIPGAFFITGATVLSAFQPVVFAAGGLCALYLTYSSYAPEKRLEDMERQLPDALFSVSSLPKSTKPEKIFEMMERGGHGALSQEAGKSLSQLSMNVKTDAVLEDLWRRNPSQMLRRAATMMKQMIASNSLDRMNSLAEDMITVFQIKRERSQLFATQKYTLLFGALLIPVILRMTLGLLGSMGLFFQGGSAGTTVTFATAMVPAYLIVYATICSAAIADAEGRRSAAMMYFLAMSLLSLLAFHFIRL